MTTRSSPDSVSGSWYVREIPPPSVGPSYYLYGPASASSTWTNTVTHGDNIPGWRQKLRDGIDATTSLSGDRITAHITNGHHRVSYLFNNKVWYDEASGFNNISITVPGANPTNLSTAKANAEALGKFNQSIRNVFTAFEGGVFAGELAQTLRMIRNPAQGIRRLADEFADIARAIRRAPHRGGNRIKNVTEALADAWLEAQFGWRPFLNDMKDGSDALTQLSLRRDNGTRRVTGKFVSREAATEGPNSGQQFAALKWATLSRTVGTVSVIYRGAVRVSARDPLVMDPQLVGFDPASWIPTAWELIPYSFLIDYFTNVGDVIRGWSQLGVNLAWSNQTIRRDYTKTSWSEQVPLEPGHSLVSFAPAKFVCSKVNVSRQKYTGTTVPSFTLRVPGFGSLRWLNIAALIASRGSDRKWVYD